MHGKYSIHMQTQQCIMQLFDLIWFIVFNAKSNYIMGIRQANQIIRQYSESYQFGEFGNDVNNWIVALYIAMIFELNVYIIKLIILMKLACMMDLMMHMMHNSN